MPLSRRKLLRWSLLVVLTAALVVGAVVVVEVSSTAPPVAQSQHGIEVPGGPQRSGSITVDATLYAPERTPAPAVLVSPGFGGSKESVATEARELAERGFVALAYSPRGFGRTPGPIALNSPDYEVADASGLVDWLAGRPEVVKDGTNDPRIGVTGGSYGGALSLLLAGTDDRIDALAPVITYNDLGQALLPNYGSTDPELPGTPAAGVSGSDGVFKQSWASLLFAAGSGAAGGLGGAAEAPEPGTESDPDDIAPPSAGGAADQGAGAAAAPGGQGQPRQGNPCGRFTEQICRAYGELAATGTASQQTRELLRSLSPASVTGNITAPTLLVQGEQDTLFGLDQSDANARQIAAAGATVKTIWYTGGHDGGSPGPQLRATIADWFDFHLRGAGADPGTGFEYYIQGSLRARGTPTVRAVTAPDYPGLAGPGAAGDAANRRTVPLAGPPQPVVNPPGGKPGAISSLPGLTSALTSSSRLAGRVAIDVPAQTARFRSQPLDSQLLITGSSRVDLRIAAAPGQRVSGGTLFAKLYDVSQNGTRTLPASAVAPIRIPALPSDGSAVRLTVTLPGVVGPIEAGHRLELAVTTTDQAYASATEPASYTIGLASNALAVPSVRGTAQDTGPPAGLLLGIGGVLLAGLAMAAFGALRRRRGDDFDPELAEVPLVIDGLRKAYPHGVVAVDTLSFRVEHGQVLGLLGPNGAGKTTTLRMMMGLIQPSEGSIRVFGHRVHGGAPVLSRIGSFVEGSGFLPHVSGLENLRLYWASTGRPQEKAHLNEALEIAGLGDAVRRPVRTYSQGMRQRLAIAQAMLGLPELLVLDEPTNGLDPPQIHQMREVLQRYAATGRTVLVSSHLLAEVEQTCTHVVVMHRGRLVAAGAVGEITSGEASETTFLVDSPATAVEVLGNLPGVSDVDAEDDRVHADLNGTPRAEALAALVHAGVAVRQAGPRRRLEDTFLRLVNEKSEA